MTAGHEIAQGGSPLGKAMQRPLAPERRSHLLILEVTRARFRLGKTRSCVPGLALACSFFADDFGGHSIHLESIGVLGLVTIPRIEERPRECIQLMLFSRHECSETLLSNALPDGLWPNDLTRGIRD